jgi:hypothetical protein
MRAPLSSTRCDVCQRHAHSLDEFDDTTDVLAQDLPTLAACYGTAVSDPSCWVPPRPTYSRARAFGLRGPCAGEGSLRRWREPARSPVIDGRDRQRLKRLRRYVARRQVHKNTSSPRLVVLAFFRGVAAATGVHGRHHGLLALSRAMRLGDIANKRDAIIRVFAKVGSAQGRRRDRGRRSTASLS